MYARWISNFFNPLSLSMTLLCRLFIVMIMTQCL
jgi:hypothetical protein